MKHVINVSGGEASWFTAECVAEQHGASDMTLLFADTFIEDDDCYRFLIESSAHALRVNRPRKIQQLCTKALSLPPLEKMQWRKWALKELSSEAQRAIPGLVWIADGRDPWDVFKDVRFIGNSRIDPCSRSLKRDFLDAWMQKNCDPAQTIQYFGLDANECHRLERLQARRAGWNVKSPLIERGIFKEFIRAEAESRNIKRPRLYDLGFPHANCGGMCVKAGQGQFKLLLAKMPERYSYHEGREQSVINHIGSSKNIGILRDRTGGKTNRISLTQFRERVEQGAQIDAFDLGGCGCALE